MSSPPISSAVAGYNRLCQDPAAPLEHATVPGISLGVPSIELPKPSASVQIPIAHRTRRGSQFDSAVSSLGACPTSALTPHRVWHAQRRWADIGQPLTTVASGGTEMIACYRTLADSGALIIWGCLQGREFTPRLPAGLAVPLTNSPASRGSRRSYSFFTTA